MKSKKSKISIVIVSTFLLSSCQTTIEEITQSVAEYGQAADDYLDSSGLSAYYAENKKEIWIATGVIVGAVITYKIAKHLSEEDGEKMGQATGEAATTGNTSKWSNSRNNTSGQARVIKEQQKQDQVEIKVLKNRVKKVPPLEMIGETYRVRKTTDVRGGPSEDYKVVGNLKKKIYVNVVGKVKESEWYLVSQDGIGSGFVHEDLLKAAPGEKPSSNGSDIDDEDVTATSVAASRTCRIVEQSIVLADGSSHTDEVEACQGANGWEATAS